MMKIAALMLIEIIAIIMMYKTIGVTRIKKSNLQYYQKKAIKRKFEIGNIVFYPDGNIYIKDSSRDIKLDEFVKNKNKSGRLICFKLGLVFYVEDKEIQQIDIYHDWEIIISLMIMVPIFTLLIIVANYY